MRRRKNLCEMDQRSIVDESKHQHGLAPVVEQFMAELHPGWLTLTPESQRHALVGAILRFYDAILDADTPELKAGCRILQGALMVRSRDLRSPEQIRERNLEDVDAFSMN